MKHTIIFLLTCFVAAHASAAAKPCDELKSAIVAKLQGKGVKGAVLEIVDADKVAGDVKVVGSCDGGAKKITYAKK